MTKPFVLPQEHPSFYNYTLKSYNVPSLAPTSVSFHPSDAASLLNH